jgi:hypothetical protein
MANEARKRGLPPELPVMAALVESRMENVDKMLDHDSLGYFQMRVSIWNKGQYAGFPTDPQKQIDWFLDEAEKLKGKYAGADASRYGDWVADTERPAFQYRGRYAERLADAQKLLQQATPAPVQGAIPDAALPAFAAGQAPAGGGGTKWLAAARGQLGVREVGYNAGKQVGIFQHAAGVGAGAPWCASFVTWSLEQSGHKMPGGGWAAVASWVGAARRGEHGLSIVDPAHARPGDIVCYDWGKGNDFGSDGHIGFLDSQVRGGKFTAIEGNADDAVSRQARNLGMANVVFIRVGG